MLTWILIAVIVAALFGVINFDHIREWSIERSKEAWPYIQKFFPLSRRKNGKRESQSRKHSKNVLMKNWTMPKKKPKKSKTTSKKT